MTEKFVTLPREVLEQALNALDAGVKISPNSVLHDRLRAALEKPQVEQEPVGYEYVEHRPYGAPGEIRRCTILLEHYRNADGTIAGDWEWLVQQFKTSKNTISMRPLYTQPQPQAEQEPVAWRLLDDDPIPGTKPKWVYYDKYDFVNGVDPTEHFQLECLYTRPQPKRDPLPDHYINNMFSAASIAEGDMFRRFARAIEAAHNIK